MPANTPKGYPYPVGTDRLMDGDDAIAALATAVDTKAGSMASGAVTVTLNNQIQLAATVTFPVGRFNVIPFAVASTENGSMIACPTGVTTTSMQIFGVSKSGGAYTGSSRIPWIARQE